MAKDYVRVYNSVTRANVKLVPNQAEPLHTTAAELANEPSESVHIVAAPRAQRPVAQEQ
jgi:hypothetical protein